MGNEVTESTKGLAKMAFALPRFVELILTRVATYLCFIGIMRMGMPRIHSGLVLGSLNRVLLKLLKCLIRLSLFFNISDNRRRSQSRPAPLQQSPGAAHAHCILAAPRDHE